MLVPPNAASSLYDGRHGSYEFAHDAGHLWFGPQYFFETVITHFGLRTQFECSMRLVASWSASHNPPRDNGYKVFWADSGNYRST